MVHRLKIDSKYYDESLRNAKTFEIRRDDRGFKVGDTLELWEWDDSRLKLTGRHHAKTVTYILSGRDAAKFLQPGYIAMGLAPGA